MVDLHNGLKTVVVLFIMKLLMTDHAVLSLLSTGFVVPHSTHIPLSRALSWSLVGGIYVSW